MKVHRLCRYADGTLMTVCGGWGVKAGYLVIYGVTIIGWFKKLRDAKKIIQYVDNVYILRAWKP